MKTSVDFIDMLIILAAGCVGGWPMALSAWVIILVIDFIFAG